MNTGHPHDIPNHFRTHIDVVLPEGLNSEAVRWFLIQVLERIAALRPGQTITVSDDQSHSRDHLHFYPSGLTAALSAPPADPPPSQPEIGLGVSVTCQRSQDGAESAGGAS